MSTSLVFKARPYQEDAVKALTEGFKKAKKGTLVLPTGGGKTFTAWRFLKSYLEKGKKILWVVHRDYLISQCIEGMKNNGINASYSLWTADEKDDSGDVVIAMIMSTRTLQTEFDWIIYDECHRAAALSYKNLEKRVKHKYKLGLSATPERLDKKELDLGEILYQISFAELVDLSFLAKPDIRVIKTGQKFQFTVSGGDISKQSLKKLNNSDRNHVILKHVLEQGVEGRKILVFGVDIDHVKKLKSLVEKVAPGVCFLVHSKQSKAERAEALSKFGEESPKALCNCEVFTEGYDQKDITDIVMARATVSRALWVQMVGRGARIIPGIKDSFKLWIPIDDINKYSWLAREWCLSEANTDIRGSIGDPKYTIEKVEEAAKKLNVELKDLSTSEKLVIVGIITATGNYRGAEREVFTVTEDRFKCLKILAYYFRNQPEPSEGDDLKSYIEGSYAYCVTAGEFRISEWKALAWPFYFRWFKGRKVTSGGRTTWSQMYVNKPDIDQSEIKETFEENTSIVVEINERVATKVQEAGGFKPFWNSIIDEARPYIPPSSIWVSKRVKKIVFRDRSLILQTDIKKFKPSITHFSQVIGYIFSQRIEDDNMTVNTRLKSKEKIR
jgi:superfamily II DNA or RNA helicase